MPGGKEQQHAYGQSVRRRCLADLSDASTSAATSLRRGLSLSLKAQLRVHSPDSVPRLPDSLQARQATAKIVAHLPPEKWPDVLRDMQALGCLLMQVTSRPSSRFNGCSTDLLIDVRMPHEAAAREKLVEGLDALGRNVTVFVAEEQLTWDTEQARTVEDSEADDSKQVWFPRHPADLDKVVSNVLQVDESSIDHPGTRDAQYQERRRMFSQLAFDHKHDKPIPLVSYSDEENRTWSTVFTRLCDLYEKHACKEFLGNFRQLQEVGLYRSDRIPQLRQVSAFVSRRSGFTLRPVAGYLSARDFLSALALRVFCCTQYIRHWERPFYTPEPDCCHELLGHVPMLADPEFAQFSQEIGLASLGASDEDVQKLATCYFFTVEFGFCKEATQLKVYGAGLLACVDEFEYAVSGRAKIHQFDPEIVLQQECKVTTFQDMYFFTESFADAKEKLRRFAQTLEHKRSIVYNPYTQSIEDVSAACTSGLDAVHDLVARICWDLEAVRKAVADM